MPNDWDFAWSQVQFCPCALCCLLIVFLSSLGALRPPASYCQFILTDDSVDTNSAYFSLVLSISFHKQVWFMMSMKSHCQLKSFLGLLISESTECWNALTCYIVQYPGKLMQEWSTFSPNCTSINCIVSLGFFWLQHVCTGNYAW
jgi:hypothetical protein